MTDFSRVKSRPTVSVVIPNWNGMRWLSDCLNAVTGQSYPPEEIILVDNASTDDSITFVREAFSQVSIIELDENFGFAGAVNAGIAKVESEFVALLNTDTIADRDWVRYLVEAFQNAPETVGAITPLMVSMQDQVRIDNAGDSFSWYGEATKIGHGASRDEAPLRSEVLSPSAGATMYRSSFLRDCAGFDDQFFAYLEDVDLGLRGRILGYQYWIEPKSVVLHYSHGSKIDYQFYIRLVTQNRLLLFVKNIPLSRLVKYAPKIIYGQIYYLLAFGHLQPFLAGYWGFIRRLPHALKQRRKIQRLRRIHPTQLDKLLSHSKPEPGIRHHLTKLIHRIVN